MQGFCHDCVEISFAEQIREILEREIDTIMGSASKYVSNSAFRF